MKLRRKEVKQVIWSSSQELKNDAKEKIKKAPKVIG